MPISSTSGFFVGTSTSVGVSIANNAASTGAEQDMFGVASAEGWFHLFLYYTGTAAAGSIDIKLFYSQVTGVEAEDQETLSASVVPISGSQKIYLGSFLASRFMIGQVTNNAIGAGLTNVSLGYLQYTKT